MIGLVAGNIIGRGWKVNSMSNKSGTKICIEGSSHKERIIVLSGSLNSKIKAYTLICKILEGQKLRKFIELGEKRQRGSGHVS